MKALDRRVTGRVTEIYRTVDAEGAMIGYQLGTGYKGTVANVILSATEIKIGLAYSAEFYDPDCLLRGSGKVHKHVPISTEGELRKEAFLQLIDQSAAACRKMLNG